MKLTPSPLRSLIEFLNCLATAALLALVSGCADPRPRAENFYEKPLTSPGGKFGALPTAAQNSIRAQTGSAEIADIVTNKNPNRVVYRVDFVNDDLFPPLYVAQDGAILNPDLSVGVPADTSSVSNGGHATGVRLSEMPAKVAEVLHEHAPGGEMTSAEKETWGNRIVYIVSFKDETRFPKLYIASDGTILKDIQK
jgi:hypothetical protein